KAPVRVIIGNPPYSVGQKSANDNAQNLKYAKLDNRIANTYALKSSAGLSKSLYDTYIKAFRWASDRIESCKDGGIVAFISNGAWIDGNAHDGLRRCLEDEYSSIYVLNLRGNARTSGEQRRKESGNVFGEGSRTPITITFLVKNPNKTGKANIYYHDIGDYLTREQKLKMVKDFCSIDGIEWKQIQPNDKHDWINQRDGVFDTLVPLCPEKKFDGKAKSIFCFNGPAIATGRDSWVYNFSQSAVGENMSRMIDFYNSQTDKFQQIIKGNTNAKVEDVIDSDQSKISWTRALRRHVEKGDKYTYNKKYIRETSYRPFIIQTLFSYWDFIESPGFSSSIFPTVRSEKENIQICFSCAKGVTAIVTNIMADYHLSGDSQCFPLYWYEENKNRQLTLFDSVSDEKYIRRDGITDWILNEVRSHYENAKNITKEMIFYYVYGLLHSAEYRERFADDLKKSLPRIPIVDRVEDFMDFSLYGKKLAELHLNYETVAPHPDVKVNVVMPKDDKQDDYDYYRVDKLRFLSKNDKSVIIYNGNIRIENIPAKAYDYIVNGKSAIDWIVERYCISIDKNSGIRNDANDWAREHGKPRYILDLLLSVINVSTQTVDIVNRLPQLKF
nr:helicase [Bacteroidaceae bacterium]